MAGTYGGIDILVSNAAVNPVFGSALDADEAAWEKAGSVGHARRPLTLLPRIPRRGGSIVLVSSLAGYMPFPVRAMGGAGGWGR
uniref:Uncharacterized protein n=1 Tax=Accipiter nisus TaxID=211598 RepID=A0A8B9M9U5_9AVES